MTKRLRRPNEPQKPPGAQSRADKELGELLIKICSNGFGRALSHRGSGDINATMSAEKPEQAIGQRSDQMLVFDPAGIRW